MAQDTIVGSDSVYSALITKVNNDIAELFAAIAGLTAGSGVLITLNDTTPGYLDGKLLVPAEGSLVLTEGNDGGNETLTISIAHKLTHKAADYVIPAAYINGMHTFTNYGAVGAINFSLPDGFAGARIRFMVGTAQYLRITANGVQRFRFGADLGAAGGYIRSNTIGTVIDLEFFPGLDQWFVLCNDQLLADA